ncbi:soluble component of the flagellar export system [Buchnera aphidicola (Cinara tujafilina)]|uniref:Flagellar assembly protein FliH n=1 Tax=Buchnera aphidicola (Cinara tujafilina) TaxID=261317 RepID=F7WYY7_9GAMM|nr:FliH/SctL family protein [Buchnera aphidicola]AEH39637.1 soluble component of the flagellar export system [Buchnera aphidicola (Cinara tujafilina)]
MNNSIKKKNWKHWSPDSLSSHHPKHILPQRLSIIKNTSINIDKQKKLTKKMLKKYLKGYKIGFDQGYKSGWFQGFNSITQSHFNNYEKYLKIYFLNILKEFNKSIDDLDSKVELKILKIIVTISKIIFSKTLLINTTIILDKIKNIIQCIKNSLKNPKLFIHPLKRKLIEEKFGTLLKLYNWKLIDDMKININSCYILTDEGEVDATVERCWNEIESILLLRNDKKI